MSMDIWTEIVYFNTLTLLKQPKIKANSNFILTDFIPT